MAAWPARADDEAPTPRRLIYAAYKNEAATEAFNKGVDGKVKAKDPSFRKGGRRVDAPGRGLVGAKGEYPLRVSYLRRTWTRSAVPGHSQEASKREFRVNVAKTVFTADNASNVSAVVYAPGGRIGLRNQGNYVGAFVGGSVKVGKGALVQARSP